MDKPIKNSRSILLALIVFLCLPQGPSVVAQTVQVQDEGAIGASQPDQIQASQTAPANFAGSSEQKKDAKQMREDIVNTAKKYVGARYEYGKTGPDSFDCSGFICTVAYEAASKKLPRTAKALYSFVKIIPQNKLEKGDIVFFRTTRDGSISHAGIYIGGNQFMHAVSDGPNTGVIVSSLKENTWKNAYAGSGKFLPSAESDGDEAAGSERSGQSAVSPTSAGTLSAPGSASAARGASAAGSASAGGKRQSGKNGTSGNKRLNEDLINNLIVDATLGIDWSLFTSSRFLLNFRGVPLTLNARYAPWPLQPGINTGIRLNTGVGSVQIPLMLSVTANDYLRFYAGPVITLGDPDLPGGSKKIEASFFPGMIGLSWNTPSFTTGKIKASLTQDIVYSVFNATDGSALSFKNSLASGLVFSTGVRVTLPLSSFFK
ncbi:C40 family peptidase [Treponema parvum]|uniref:C40 family peptidase n=1 Tax=Treponema parvum TaxID=138851 RepID=UPI001AEBF9FA|nr:C40 family peptidase [Treponema parvum]QTQ17076.1 C40 family peptidase [Treponema parvum]